MAKAERTKVTITKEVPGVQLTLTEGEADFLLAVLARVGGSGTASPRKYGAAISAALQKATGLTYTGTDAHPLAAGHITFSQYGTAVFNPARLGSLSFGFRPQF